MRNNLFYMTIFSLLLATACSSEQPSDLMDEQLEASRDISAEERQAARALSLVDSGQITAVDPYEKARQCSVAIGALTSSVEGLGTFSPEQVQVLADAKAVYDRRMRSEGSGAEQLSQDSPQPQDEEGSDTAEQARTAIACLRELGLR